MRKLMVLFALMIALGQWGCQSLAGSASGNSTPVSGYDSNSHYQMNQLEEDYRDQRISRRDYEIRKGQVEIGFILTRRSLLMTVGSTKGKKPIEEAFKTIARQSKVAVEVLRGEDRRWEITKKRAEAVALLIQEHGYWVGEVAKYLRRDQAHISTMLSRLSAREKERDRESL